MNCINHYTGLGEIPICDGAIILPLTADVSGNWAFITSFNGAYQYVQFHQEANQNIVIPAPLNEDYTYIFRLYKPDSTIWNDTYYCMHTIPYAGGVLNICNENGETVQQLQTGKLQFTAIDGQDMASFIEALEVGGNIKTAQPSANGAGAIKIGKITTGAAVTIQTDKYLEVEIDGVIRKIAIVN